jgi:hypothetical protein
MSRRALLSVGLVLSLGACDFAPDFSRYPTCADAVACPEGYTCLASEGVCLPDCGARGPCGLESPPASTDSGAAPDASQPRPPVEGGGADGGPRDGGATDGGATGSPDGGGSAGTDGGAPASDAGDAGGQPPPPLVLGTEQPPDGVEGEGFSFTFQAQGGTRPYTFTTPGPLPPGLSLDTTGRLSGPPSGSGDFTFPLEVKDASAPAPQGVSQSVTVRINPVLRVAGPLILADFPKARVYAERISAVGGRPPYTFELLVGNALPSGLVLYNDGSVRGTSSTSGAASSFEVRVWDSARPPRATSRGLQLTPSTCSPGLCVRTRALPDARVGEAYTYALQADTSTSAATWSLEKGPLPTGLQLSPDGVLSGTPTQAGTTEVTLCISEWLGSVFGTRSVTLTLRVF